MESKIFCQSKGKRKGEMDFIFNGEKRGNKKKNDLDQEAEKFCEAENGKWAMILGSSYGMSFLGHLGVILLLMVIYLVKPISKKPPVIVASPPSEEANFEEKLPLPIKNYNISSKPNKITEGSPTCPGGFGPEKTFQKPKWANLDTSGSHSSISDYALPSHTEQKEKRRICDIRFSKKKWKLYGCGPHVYHACKIALNWLYRHQSPEGFWSSSHYDKYCLKYKRLGYSIPCRNIYPVPYDSIQKQVDPQNIGRGMEGYDAGVTGLALLAFLAQGHTHNFGFYRHCVRKGIEWIIKIQVNDPSSKWHGSIGYIINGHKSTHPEWIYNHLICTMALCEAYAITRDYVLREYAQRAVDFMVKCQNPGLGWRYDENSPEKPICPQKNDTSVTGWAVLALKAAELSKSFGKDKIIVSKSAWQGAVEWFRRVTDSSGQAGYMTPGGGSSFLTGRQGIYHSLPTTTAISVLCRILAGESRNNPDICRGRDILVQNLPHWDPNNYKSVNMYYWYYGTYAMFQIGGTYWDCGKYYDSIKSLINRTCHCWNHAMQEALLLTQRGGYRKDDAYGSWDPVGTWGIAGGRVYATALGALTLEIYYRYERIVGRY